MTLSPCAGEALTSPVLTLRVVDPQGADAIALLMQATAEARVLYADLFAVDAPPPMNLPATPGSVYLVAYRGDEPVGCGALRRIDALMAEVRRMFVAVPARREGVARAVLAALDTHARGLHYRVLRLETGNRQAPAIALYESCGFRRIAPFGPYVGDPTSVCFEKLL